MNPSTIQRYQPGFDIYASNVTKYGATAANAIAAAARTGDNYQVNAAMSQAENGAARNASLFSIFGNQLVTDPLGAPLDGLNNTLWNTIKSFLRNPAVLFALVVILFLALGGFGLIARKFNKLA